jgi:outer membrane protein TolC
LCNGLATLPEVSLARQQEPQAAFDLEDVLATERDAQVGLAESIGIPPTTQIQVTDFSSLPPPAALEDSVEKVIDQALDRQPDLIAKVAALRGKEAEVRRARAAYFPTLSLVSNFNTIVESSPEGRILCPRFGDKFQMGALINMPGAVHMPLT